MDWRTKLPPLRNTRWNVKNSGYAKAGVHANWLSITLPLGSRPHCNTGLIAHAARTLVRATSARRRGRRAFPFSPSSVQDLRRTHFRPPARGLPLLFAPLRSGEQVKRREAGSGEQQCSSGPKQHAPSSRTTGAGRTRQHVYFRFIHTQKE